MHHVFCSLGLECMVVSHQGIAPEIPPWNVSHPRHTYTVETSWFSQPPGEMSFSGEVAAPGSLKTWEQVKFTSDSCVPRSFQTKCLSCSEMGSSVCPAMTSSKRRPSNEREGHSLSKAKPFHVGTSDVALQCSAVKDFIWTVGGWWRGTVLSMDFYSCSKLQPPSKALPNDKVRFFISHFIRHLTDTLVS